MRKGQTTYYEYDAAGKLRQSVLVDGSGSNATNLLGAVLLLRIRREIRRREAKKAEKTAQEA